MRSLWIVIKEIVKAKFGPKGDKLYYYPNKLPVRDIISQNSRDKVAKWEDTDEV